MENSQWDVVIVGGGSAGLSAALMVGRSRRRVLVIDGGEPRNRFAAHIHGVLSRDGYSPLQLLEDGRRELDRYGVVFRSARVVDARSEDARIVLVTDEGEDIATRRLLVATGLRDELPAIEGLAELWGRGVASCPYCDGYEVRDSRIGSIATSPMSMHQVQLLRQISETVTYFTQGEYAPSAEERARLEARGVRIDERPVRRVLSENGELRGLELADGATVELDAIFTGPKPIALDGILRALGAERAEAYGGSWVAVDPMGKTSVPGVWAAGNVVNPGAVVPVASGAGTSAGAAINADLVREDFDLAVAGRAK